MECFYRRPVVSLSFLRPYKLYCMKTGADVCDQTYSVLWKNKLLHTTAQVSSSCGTYSSVISHKTLCHWRIQKYSLGSCIEWTSSSRYFCTGGSMKSIPKDKLNGDQASQEKMQGTKDRLADLVSNLFSGRQNYAVLHKNIVLENNLFGKDRTCRGLLSYAVELLKVRLRIHAQFSAAFVEIKDIKFLEQGSIIRIQWCLKAVSQTKVVQFMKHIKRMAPVAQEDYDSLEAYSYFHVDKDGLVLKHRIDRIIPRERELDQLKN